MADEDLLSLDEVRHVEVDIDTSAAKPRPRHVFAPPADHAVVKTKKIVLAVELLNVALNYRDPPAFGQPIVAEHLQHVLVPEIFPFCVFVGV